MRTSDYYRLVLNVFELSAFISGLVYWKKYRSSMIRYFILFLGLIFFNEMTGHYLLQVKKDKILNGAFYNYYAIPVQFLFYFLFFYLVNKKSGYLKSLKWPPIFALIYLACLSAEWSGLFVSFYWFYSVSYSVGNLLLLILVIQFLARFINSEQILQVKQSFMFWVCIGLLSFFLITFPFYAMTNYLAAEFRRVYRIYWYINIVFDCIMYFCFVIAFVCGKEK